MIKLNWLHMHSTSPLNLLLFSNFVSCLKMINVLQLEQRQMWVAANSYLIMKARILLITNNQN